MSAAAVVLDTNVFGANLRPGRWDLATRYTALIGERAVLISFQTVAELEFGARRARWGPRRRTALALLIDQVTIIWSGPQLVERYAELRARAVMTGHGLAERSHEADRWIAATALLLGVPLVSHDKVFVGAPGLDLVTLA